MRQNKADIEQHIANVSASRNTTSDGLLTKMASPVSLLNPPGTVNPAAKVSVARRAAITDSVARTSPKFVFVGWMYVVFSRGCIPIIRMHISSCILLPIKHGNVMLFSKSLPPKISV